MTDSIHWTEARNRPGLKGCHCCDRQFRRHEEFMVSTEQISTMRGDDIVLATCADCAAAAGHVVPMPRIDRQIAGVRGAITGLQKKLAELSARLDNLEAMKAQ